MLLQKHHFKVPLKIAKNNPDTKPILKSLFFTKSIEDKPIVVACDTYHLIEVRTPGLDSKKKDGEPLLTNMEGQDDLMLNAEFLPLTGWKKNGTYMAGDMSKVKKQHIKEKTNLDPEESNLDEYVAFDGHPDYAHTCKLTGDYPDYQQIFNDRKKAKAAFTIEAKKCKKILATMKKMKKIYKNASKDVNNMLLKVKDSSVTLEIDNIEYTNKMELSYHALELPESKEMQGSVIVNPELVYNIVRAAYQENKDCYVKFYLFAPGKPMMIESQPTPDPEIYEDEYYPPVRGLVMPVKQK